jgi:hypothetical protein
MRPAAREPLAPKKVNQPAEHLRMPVETVPVIEVVRIVEIMLRIFHQGCIGLGDLLIQHKAAGGKFDNGKRIVTDIIACPFSQWGPFLRANQRLAALRLKGRFHAHIKSVTDLGNLCVSQVCARYNCAETRQQHNNNCSHRHAHRLQPSNRNQQDESFTVAFEGRPRYEMPHERLSLDRIAPAGRLALIIRRRLGLCRPRFHQYRW